MGRTLVDKQEIGEEKLPATQKAMNAECLMYSFETIPPPERADVARNSLAWARNSTFDSVCCIAVELLLNFRVEIQNAYM